MFHDRSFSSAPFRAVICLSLVQRRAEPGAVRVDDHALLLPRPDGVRRKSVDVDDTTVAHHHLEAANIMDVGTRIRRKEE
jgi:hypothetical protein